MRRLWNFSTAKKTALLWIMMLEDIFNRDKRRNDSRECSRGAIVDERHFQEQAYWSAKQVPKRWRYLVPDVISVADRESSIYDFLLVSRENRFSPVPFLFLFLLCVSLLCAGLVFPFFSHGTRRHGSPTSRTSSFLLVILSDNFLMDPRQCLRFS